MSLVWDSGLYEGSTLLTLLALADWANEEGICFPSVASIAQKSRQSERNAQRCVAQLVSDVSVWRKFQKDKVSVYRINIRKFQALASGDKLSPGDMLSPVTSPSDGVTPTSPKPPLKPSVSKTLFGKSLRSSPANGNGKPEPDKPIDPRFQPIVKACKACWPDGVLFDMGPEDGAAINRMLARRHRWTAEEIADCIVFRFLSENINSGESIKAWIGAVCDYSTGPRDKFDVPKPPIEYWRKQARKILYGELPEQKSLAVISDCYRCDAKYDIQTRAAAPERDRIFCSDSCSQEYAKREQQLTGAAS